MNFDEHLANHRNADGSYDLDAAEEDRRHEIEANPGEVVRLAAKAARQERVAWQSLESQSLRKQFEQPALSPSLELDVKVPLGNGMVVRLGDMNPARITIRKDMRIKAHLDEIRAYGVEMTHWLHTEPLLKGAETIEDAIQRGVA